MAPNEPKDTYLLVVTTISAALGDSSRSEGEGSEERELHCFGLGVMCVQSSIERELLMMEINAIWERYL